MPKYHLDKSFIKEPMKFSDISVVQIGRRYFEQGDVMKPHVHKHFYELTIITDGEGEVFANGVGTPVKRGDIFLSLPFDMHRIVSSETAPMKYDFFSFSTENEHFSATLEEISGYLSPEERVFNDERVHALVCDAMMEFIESTKFSNELLYSVFTQIIIHIIRNIEEGNKARTRNATQPQAICYQLMNYNYSYLSNLFKKTTGDTLLSYYHKKRLDVARQLIAEGTMKMTEIAETLNYSSLYSFSRAFKESFGISPRQYAQTL